ncbi:hypothetical protein VTO42DRAFT_5228 [Malbranchea cinnamomea]
MATVTATRRTALRGLEYLSSRNSVDCVSLNHSFRCQSLPPLVLAVPLHQPQSSCRWSSILGRRYFHATPSPATSSKISYRVAVSSCGKGRPFSPGRNVYNFDPTTQDAIGIQVGNNRLQRKLSRPLSGEDAFFVSKVGDSDRAVAFGVADGVGGWSDSGIDPADFSHGFCTYMAETASAWASPAEKLRAVSLMQAGYDKALNDESILAGGSTACVGIGYENGTVQLANLGDSGSVLFRLAAVHHYSVPQTHGFNAPYQLSALPPILRLQAQLFGGRQYEDLPEDANVTNCKMQHGDVLVLATDGVFDNLNNHDILKVITKQMLATGAWSGTAGMGIDVTDKLDALTKPGGLASLMPDRKFRVSTPEPSSQPPKQETSVDPHTRNHTLQALLALAVAGEAKIMSMDARRDGPFAKESRRYYPFDPWRGGKPDDICVLVVVAVEEGRDSS